MNIKMTVRRNGDECSIFADVFPGALNEPCLTARPAIFMQRRLYAVDDETGLLTVPLEEAKKMAREILEL